MVSQPPISETSTAFWKSCGGGQVLSQYQPVEEDTALKALEAMQIQEEDYFCQVTHRTWGTILHVIREAHKDDMDSAPDGSNAMKLIKGIGCAGFLSGCVYRPHVYEASNPV